MSALREAEKILSSMTRAEKAQVLQWVARDLGDAFPGIESTPAVRGGEARIVRKPSSFILKGCAKKATRSPNRERHPPTSK